MSKFFDSFASSVSGGLGSLATGALGSLFGSVFGSGRDPAEEQFARNKELMAIQHRYNTDSSILGSRLVNENWQRQFDAQNVYNTPYAQFQRMLKAGLNPYVSNSEVTGSSSMGSSAAGSTIGTGLPSSTLYDPSVSYSHFMDGISKLATASGHTIANASLNRKINAEIESMISDKQLKDAQAAIQVIEKDYLPKIKDAQLKNMAEDTLLKVAQAMASKSESALKDALYDTEKQIQAMNSLKREKLGFDLASAIVQYNYLVDFLQARLDNLMADTEAKRAGATESRAAAKEHESSSRLKAAQAEFQEFDNEMRSFYKPEFVSNYLNKLVKENEISAADAEEARLRFERLARIREKIDKSDYDSELDATLEWLKGKIPALIVAK